MKSHKGGKHLKGRGSGASGGSKSKGGKQKAVRQEDAISDDKNGFQEKEKVWAWFDTDRKWRHATVVAARKDVLYRGGAFGVGSKGAAFASLTTAAGLDALLPPLDIFTAPLTSATAASALLAGGASAPPALFPGSGLATAVESHPSARASAIASGASDAAKAPATVSGAVTGTAGAPGGSADAMSASLEGMSDLLTGNHGDTRSRSEENLKEGGTSKDSTSGEDDRQVYVHFEGMDRRLDQWLTLDLLRPLSVEMKELCSGECEARGSGGSQGTGGAGVCECVVMPPAGTGGEEKDDLHAGMDQAYLREHEEHTKFKTISKIQMGEYEVDCWYFSPYPLGVQNTPKLHICVFCLSFFKHQIELDHHSRRCHIRHPPGNEIHRGLLKGRLRPQPRERSPEKSRIGQSQPLEEPQVLGLAMWEVDGSLCRIYCENLCFLSKLFLDHKTLRHSVGLFLFYILTEMREDGYHIAGYFSKEKYSRNNVSCILILPQHQKKGYGKYLINFSYALALKEGRRGTPERPLSDLGLESYLNYWRQILLSYITSLAPGRSTKEEDRSKSPNPNPNPHSDHKARDKSRGQSKKEKGGLGPGGGASPNGGNKREGRQVKLESKDKEKDDEKISNRDDEMSEGNRPGMNTVVINELADLFAFEPTDVQHCFEDADMLLQEPHTKTPFIYAAPDHIFTMSARLGKPAPAVVPVSLQWLPYDPFLGPFECAADG